MKLRIKGSSLRLRVTRGELRNLAESGVVEERVPFGVHSALTYRLVRDPGSGIIDARYEQDVLEVRVPAEAVERWQSTDLVTLATAQPVPGGELKISLEKDFACLGPREGEDESDNFPHPQEDAGARCG